MPFDRRFALLDSNQARAGKVLTGRIQQRLLTFRSSVRGTTVVVRTPSGAEYEIGDPTWLGEFEREIGQPAALRASDAPIHDAADLLVVNEESIRVLADEYGAHVNPLRFRPNVILEGADARPFDEGRWVGMSFAAGDAVLEAFQACQRCVMITIDPETFESDPSFLRLIVEKHDANLGVYCKVVRAGVVATGDLWTAESAVEAAS